MSDNVEKIQVNILGLSTSPSSAGAYALILKEIDGNRRLPIIIGAFEAQSIALEMEGIKPPRPLTHDLLKNVIEAMDVTLQEVFIHELRDGTFFAKITIETLTDLKEIDSRPSDAIALAIRFGVPVYVADSIMEEAGITLDTESTSETPASDLPPEIQRHESRLEHLQNVLKEAIDKEEYEKAAKLRDQMRKLSMGD
jgi:hypothetical protein